MSLSNTFDTLQPIFLEGRDLFMMDQLFLAEQHRNIHTLQDTDPMNNEPGFVKFGSFSRRPLNQTNTDALLLNFTSTLHLLVMFSS